MKKILTLITILLTINAYATCVEDAEALAASNALIETGVVLEGPFYGGPPFYYQYYITTYQITYDGLTIGHAYVAYGDVESAACEAYDEAIEWLSN